MEGSGNRPAQQKKSARERRDGMSIGGRGKASVRALSAGPWEFWEEHKSGENERWGQWDERMSSGRQRPGMCVYVYACIKHMAGK